MMNQNKNGLLGAIQESVEIKRETNSTTANGARFLREVAPQVGWFSLAAGVKPSRTRQQKRGWNRSTK